VAVSGGADSMVLLELLHLLGYKITVAHCNFNLRPGDCDLDQKLVEDYCFEKEIICYVQSFNTKQEARKRKISLEMAARDLRYAWFEELRQFLSADYIATGHHMNDNVETVLLNTTRGAGLRGLTAMKPIQGNIVRPMLFATRQQIEICARACNIPFRNDSSNRDVTIPRNRFRNLIVPEMQNINPSFIQTMQQNTEVWNDWYQFSMQHLHKLMKERVKNTNLGLWLELNPLDDKPTQRLLFFELLSDLGYGGNQTANYQRILKSQTGVSINTPRHKITREREGLLVSEIESNPLPDFFEIKSLPFLTSNPFAISIEVSAEDVSRQYNEDKNIECVDFEKVTKPLTIRKWQPGDRFYPLGMNGSKKVSDFLTDLKISSFEKQNQLVLEDKKGIIWVVGLRIDKRYATEEKSQTFLVLRKKNT
jgi:tRNA(Ile)-lysidine synthase